MTDKTQLTDLSSKVLFMREKVEALEATVERLLIVGPADATRRIDSVQASANNAGIAAQHAERLASDLSARFDRMSMQVNDTLEKQDVRLADVERIVPQAKTMADGIAALIDATTKAREAMSFDTRRIDNAEGIAKRALDMATRASNDAHAAINALTKALGDGSEIFTRLNALEQQTAFGKSNPRQAQWIVIHGNPVDGCEYYGPIDTAEEANELGERLGGEWWAKELTL